MSEEAEADRDIAATKGRSDGQSDAKTTMNAQFANRIGVIQSASLILSVGLMLMHTLVFQPPCWLISRELGRLLMLPLPTHRFVPLRTTSFGNLETM